MIASLSSGWQQVLAPHRELIESVVADRGPGELPHTSQLFRALEVPLDQVKVVILGQDPYPTPGHANGLAFSVGADVRPLPPTLRNIFTEYVADTGYATPTTGDLSPWVKRGVLLLNRTLSVSPHEAPLSRREDWLRITHEILTAVVSVNPTVVAVLWGKEAGSEQSRFVDPLLSAHPSPLSAYRGFFGSRPFSRTNQALSARGVAPIEWRLP